CSLRVGLPDGEKSLADDRCAHWKWVQRTPSLAPTAIFRIVVRLRGEEKSHMRMLRQIGHHLRCLLDIGCKAIGADFFTATRGKVGKRIFCGVGPVLYTRQMVARNPYPAPRCRR